MSEYSQGHLTELLYSASTAGELSFAQELIGKGACVNHINSFSGASPLLGAVDHWDYAMVDLLARSGADLNATGTGKYYDSTPLMVGYQKAQMVALLLQHGADPDVQKTKSLNTVLHLAALSNSVDTVVVLLRHGCRRDLRNWHGHTALDEASMTGCDEVAALLRAYEAADRADSVMTLGDNSFCPL